MRKKEYNEKSITKLFHLVQFYFGEFHPEGCNDNETWTFCDAELNVLPEYREVLTLVFNHMKAYHRKKGLKKPDLNFLLFVITGMLTGNDVTRSDANTFRLCAYKAGFINMTTLLWLEAPNG